MGLRQLIRKLVNEKEPNRKLQDPEKNQKNMVKVDPLERIAALKAADWDLTILLSRTSGVSSGGIKQWHITEVDPLTFYDLVSESLGAGAYRMEFRKADATLLRLEGSEKLETHTFAIAGKLKATAEAKEREKAKSGDFWQDFMKEGNIGQMVVKTFLDKQGKPDELLMELLKTAIGDKGSNADPTALLANVTETVVKLKEAAGDAGVDPMQSISQFMTMMNQYNLANKPPVTATGSNSSGLDKFFESLGNAAPALGPIIAGALSNRGNGQDTENRSASLPAATPEAQPAFAGTQVATETSRPDPAPGDPVKKVNPLAAFSAQDLGGEASLSPASAAFGAIMKLRYMIGQEADPLDIASEMVDTINLIKGAKRVDGAWENFIDDPGVAFDEFAPLIPEWLENPQYRTECREAMVKAVTDYFESDGTEEQIIDGAEIEIANATHDTESAIETSEAAPNDTVVGIGDHEGSNDNGIIDG